MTDRRILINSNIDLIPTPKGIYKLLDDNFTSEAKYRLFLLIEDIKIGEKT
jgi:hypothetical protein